MKISLQWVETCVVTTVREFPNFILDTEEFPELELEIQRIYDARDSITRGDALVDLEYKMHEGGSRGETIIDIVTSRDETGDVNIFSVAGEEEGFLRIAEAPKADTDDNNATD